MNWRRGPWWVLGLLALLAVLLYRPSIPAPWVVGGVAVALLVTGLVAGYSHGMPMTARNLRAHARIGFLSVLGVAAAALAGNAVGTESGSGWAGIFAGIVVFAVYNAALFSVLTRRMPQRNSDDTQQRR